MISIQPDSVKPFVASDFFDGYRVLTFKDIVCTKIGDFVEVKDKIVASSVVREGFNERITICVFDTVGHYLYPLGAVGRGPGEYLYISPYIEVTRDSTIVMKSTIGWVEYRVDGRLVKESRIQNPVYGTLGYMSRKMNDSTLLFRKTSDAKKNAEKDYRLNLVSAKDYRLKKSFFPLPVVTKYITMDELYTKEDTVCFYMEEDNRIYTVREDSVIPRYRIDKGKYAVLTPYEMLKENVIALPKCLRIKRLSENKRYVIGMYLLNETYYFFLYDKRLQKNYNLKAHLEDDFLFGKIPNLFFSWEPGVQISDDYMYFHFTPLKFSRLLESVRKKLTETEWEAYRQKHPDLMQVYDGLNEESNTVVVGYKFKR